MQTDYSLNSQVPGSYCLQYLITSCAEKESLSHAVMSCTIRQTEGGLTHEEELCVHQSRTNVSMLPCECVWSADFKQTYSLASQTHFCRKGKGLVNCVYKPCLLHCRVRSNHTEVFCHMTHNKSQDIFHATAWAIKTHQLYF